MIFNRDKPSDQPSKPQTAQPAPVLAAPPKPAEPVQAAKPIPNPTTTRTGASMASVISKALKITGELESTEDIQIDGQIEGDVRGVGVKIGQNAKVKGTVYGDEVELAGTVEGKIESKKVILTGTARMTGDVWHQEIKIEAGAYISGNLKPELSKADNKTAPKPVTASTGASTGASVAPVNNPAAVSTAH
jgi:cytoskeletal protein CcmA (bactofilin family)